MRNKQKGERITEGMILGRVEKIVCMGLQKNSYQPVVWVQDISALENKIL
jgi:hypothetical protein